MCGITGFYLRDTDLKIDRDSMLDSLLLGIEHRGKDATGFVALGTDESEWHKASCEAETFCKYRRLVPESARVVLGHTRWATQGLPEFIENNHPIKRGPFFIIHNGHVNNDAELFTAAERTRYGRVDSEAIAARLSSMEDLARLGEVMEEIDGHAAVAAIDERDPSKLVLARGSNSPLYVYSGRVIVIFASTEDAIIEAHREHIGHLSKKRLFQMDEGEQLLFNDGQMVRTDFKVKKVFHWLSTPRTPVAQGSDWLRNAASWETADEREEQCDSCHTPISWRDLTYRYDHEDKLTYSFCDECTELWDYDRLDDAIDAQYADDDDDPKPIALPPAALDESYLFDDYADANTSILNSIKKGILGI